MTVPAHRGQPDRGTLRLWVVRVAARGGQSTDKHPPVIRVLGGPLPIEAFYLTNPRTAQPGLAHDNVFFDYRGLGRSGPKPACKVDPVKGAATAEHPGASHDFVIRDPCIIEIEAAFFADPERPLDRSCVATYKPVSFAREGFEAYVDSLGR